MVPKTKEEGASFGLGSGFSPLLAQAKSPTHTKDYRPPSRVRLSDPHTAGSAPLRLNVIIPNFIIFKLRIPEGYQQFLADLVAQKAYMPYS